MKKGKHFYSHIVDTSTIVVELADMDMSHEERLHLLALLESNIHHAVLDVVLSSLHGEDKKTFLFHLHADDHDEIWKLLNSKTDKMEEKIKEAAEILKRQLHQDIKEL